MTAGNPHIGGTEHISQPGRRVEIAEIPGFAFEVATASHNDHAPSPTQDTILDSDGVWGVFDGMGGHSGGDTASRIAADAVKNRVYVGSAESDLMQALLEANNAILAKEQEDSALRGMGTTGTVISLRSGLFDQGAELSWAHVGDSQLLLRRVGTDYLEQVTRDEGRGNVIFNCLGNGEGQVDQSGQLSVTDGDRVILWSDGISGDWPEQFLTDEEMREIATQPTAHEAAQKALELSKKDDDKSVIVIDVQAKDSSEAQPEILDEIGSSRNALVVAFSKAYEAGEFFVYDIVQNPDFQYPSDLQSLLDAHFGLVISGSENNLEISQANAGDEDERKAVLERISEEETERFMKALALYNPHLADAIDAGMNAMDLSYENPGLFQSLTSQMLDASPEASGKAKPEIPRYTQRAYFQGKEVVLTGYNLGLFDDAIYFSAEGFQQDLPARLLTRPDGGELGEVGAEVLRDSFELQGVLDDVERFVSHPEAREDSLTELLRSGRKLMVRLYGAVDALGDYSQDEINESVSEITKGFKPLLREFVDTHPAFEGRSRAEKDQAIRDFWAQTLAMKEQHRDESLARIKAEKEAE